MLTLVREEMSLLRAQGRLGVLIRGQIMAKRLLNLRGF